MAKKWRDYGDMGGDSAGIERKKIKIKLEKGEWGDGTKLQIEGKKKKKEK